MSPDHHSAGSTDASPSLTPGGSTRIDMRQRESAIIIEPNIWSGLKYLSDFDTATHNVEGAVVKVDHQFIFAAVAEQRHQIASLLDGLDNSQLAAPTLCLGWDVRTVAAHVVSTVEDGTAGFPRLAVRRGSLARAIDELARRSAQLPTAEIVATLRRDADHPVSPPLFGPLDPLADILVHSGDIRIPLGLPFQPDPELAALAMNFLTGPWPFGFVPLGRLRGISLTALILVGPGGGSCDPWPGRRFDDERLWPFSVARMLDGPGVTPVASSATGLTTSK